MALSRPPQVTRPLNFLLINIKSPAIICITFRFLRGTEMVLIICKFFADSVKRAFSVRKRVCF